MVEEVLYPAMEDYQLDIMIGVITCKDGGEAHEKLMSLIEVAKEENLPVKELLDADRKSVV